MDDKFVRNCGNFVEIGSPQTGRALRTVAASSSASVNWLLGGAGSDRIDGRGGNDVMFGEAGAINLGGGNFVVLNGVDTATLTATDFILG